MENYLNGNKISEEIWRQHKVNIFNVLDYFSRMGHDFLNIFCILLSWDIHPAFMKLPSVSLFSYLKFILYVWFLLHQLLISCKLELSQSFRTKYLCKKLFFFFFQKFQTQKIFCQRLLTKSASSCNWGIESQHYHTEELLILFFFSWKLTLRFHWTMLGS